MKPKSRAVTDHYDAIRRCTYPANPDPDTVALAETYRIRWHQARLLKVLSYFVTCSREELAIAACIDPKQVSEDLKRVAYRCSLKIDSVASVSGQRFGWRLALPEDRDRLKAVIATAWDLDSCSHKPGTGVAA